MLFYHPDIDLQQLTWLQPFLEGGLAVYASKQPSESGSLWLDETGLALVLTDSSLLQVPVKEDRGRLIRQAFGRAHGGTVLDACAGFGFDTDWLRDQEPTPEITYVERDLRVLLLLRERLFRAGVAVPAAHHASAQEYLSGTRRKWHTVYLDPMFAKRNKSALPKKPLQALAQLQTDSPDIESLVTVALERATHRVVLKRRRKDPTIGRPSQQLRGKKVRFDIYLSS